MKRGYLKDIQFMLIVQDEFMWRNWNKRTLCLVYLSINCLIDLLLNVTTIHSSIKMKQIEVKKKDELLIRKRLSTGHKYKLNTLVRISKARRAFKKGYLSNWTEKIFMIKSRQNSDRPLYKIVDFHREPIWTFFEQELQEVENPEEFCIESILKSKRKGKQTLHLVKWTGYDSSFNSWVNEKDIKNVFENPPT